MFSFKNVVYKYQCRFIPLGNSIVTCSNSTDVITFIRDVDSEGLVLCLLNDTRRDSCGSIPLKFPSLSYLCDVFLRDHSNFLLNVLNLLRKDKFLIFMT